MPHLPRELLDEIARCAITFRGKITAETSEESEDRLMALVAGMHKTMTSQIIANFYNLNAFRLEAPRLPEIHLWRETMTIPNSAPRVKNLEIILPCQTNIDLGGEEWRLDYKSLTLLTYLLMIPRPYTAAVTRNIQNSRNMHAADGSGLDNIQWQYMFPELEHLKIVINFVLWGSIHYCLDRVLHDLLSLPEVLIPVQPKSIEVEIRGSRNPMGCTCVENFKEFITNRVVLKE